MAWKKKIDPLYRGDSKDGVAIPDPKADAAIVPHIMYFGGFGRRTPYHSTSEEESAAQYFASDQGRVYRTLATLAESHGVKHIGRLELLKLLRKKGFGAAKWPSALEVMQARKYVEQWAEHLLDFADIPRDQMATVLKELYKP